MTQSRKEKGEKVGAGWFVFRRGSNGRIKVNSDKAGFWLPFEHPSEKAACDEADALQIRNPDKTFCVLKQVYKTTPPKPSTPKPGDF